MKRVLGSRRDLVVLCLVGLGFGLQSGVATANDTPGDTAALLAELRHDIESLRTLVRQPLTSSKIEGQCTECTKHIIFCVAHETVGWSRPADFEEARLELAALLRRIEGHADSFSDSYHPISLWMQEVPQVTSQFRHADSVIYDVREQIRSGDGPTEAQRQRVHDTLQTLHASLETSLSHLHAGVGSLTSFLHRQSGDRERAKSAEKMLEHIYDSTLASYQQQAGTFELDCARTGALAQIHQVKAEYLKTLSKVRQALTVVETSSHRAEKGIAHILAEVIASQNDVQTTLQRIQATQKDDLGSFLEQLHFGSAMHTWEDLENRLHAFSASNPWPMPAHAPSGKPWCGDFEDDINWPAPGVQQATPRGYLPSTYQPRDGVEGALFAGPYQWGGERCGGWCTSNHGHPHCTLRKP